MPIPIHTLNLYQKPKVGTGFIARFPTYNYTHDINAVGGFDTASCDIRLRSIDEGQQFLDQYIGSRVAIYVDNPAEPIWEGYIDRMTFDAGLVQYTISLDEMTNRATILYTNTSTGNTGQLTAVADNADSQALYGIKQGIIDIGYQSTVPNSTTVNAMRDGILVHRAWPKPSITRGNGSGILHIEMLGFYHTLDWESYRNTATTVIDLDDFITTLILPGLANANVFLDNTDFTDIAQNTLDINRESTRGETAWQTIQKIQEIGSSLNYWVAGVTPTLFQTGLRRVYYRSLNTDIEYTAKQADGLRVRDLYGKIVPPWTVRPDRGIRVSDMLIGWNGLGDNPTETWIRSVTYDANQQTVDWQGDDDTTAEGQFQVLQYYRQTQKRYGTTRRLV